MASLTAPSRIPEAGSVRTGPQGHDFPGRDRRLVLLPGRGDRPRLSSARAPLLLQPHLQMHILVRRRNRWRWYQQLPPDRGAGRQQLRPDRHVVLRSQPPIDVVHGRRQRRYFVGRQGPFDHRVPLIFERSDLFRVDGVVETVRVHWVPLRVCQLQVDCIS